PEAGIGVPPQTSIDSKLAELRRDYRREESRPSALQDNSPLQRRDPGPSLRDSLLKKPLGSLFIKD
ncbi:MAG: hypothetical protein ABWY49_14385, partial [Rhizobium sp.]